jgi:F-type H+-transporting ATPase subunit b
MLHDPEFWVGIAFIGLMALFVYLKVPGMLAKALDERAAKIRAELEQAEKLHRDAQALFNEYSAKQKAAMAEADEIVARAKADAARLQEEAAAELQASLGRRRQLAETKIAQAEAQAIKEVREAAVDLAIAAARNIMIAELKGAKADSLVDQAIGELKRNLH